MKRLMVLAFLLVPTLAFAEGVVVKQSTCRLTWDAPQLNADASPLADLQEYGVYIASTAAAVQALTAPTVVVPAPADPPDGATGTFVCAGLPPTQHYAQVDAVDSTGNRSGRTAVLPFVLQDDVSPQAPTNLRVGP